MPGFGRSFGHLDRPPFNTLSGSDELFLSRCVYPGRAQAQPGQRTPTPPRGRPCTDREAEGLVRSMDRRLLIVDDDPLLTDSLEFLLQQEGYDVAVASTGSDALTMVRTSPPDLVLLDVGLPDL